MRVSRNSLIVNFRFLDTAVSMLELVPYDESVATNGRCIFYNPVHILKLYKSSQEIVARNYLHMIMHCVFRHNLVNTLIDSRAWGLACDITVENIINGLDSKIVARSDEKKQTDVIAKIKKQCKYVTAEKIYAYLISGDVSEETIDKWRLLFSGDDHEIWYRRDNGSGGSDDKNNSNGSESSDSGGMNEAALDALAEAWKETAEKMQVDLESFSKKHGDQAGDLMQNLQAVNREKYNYESFLKKFAVMGEAMKINDDEFDYIFYTYGMQLYGKMPLIEPLEYKEVKRIKEFVIAIDTSGSVQGELVQRFIQKTYNILKQEESFFTKINLHIIQCDAEIREDIKITSQEEFDEYLKTMRLRGFGGTDFCPVFSYVDELIRKQNVCKNFIYSDR